MATPASPSGHPFAQSPNPPRTNPDLKQYQDRYSHVITGYLDTNSKCLETHRIFSNTVDQIHVSDDGKRHS